MNHSCFKGHILSVGKGLLGFVKGALTIAPTWRLMTLVVTTCTGWVTYVGPGIEAVSRLVNPAISGTKSHDLQVGSTYSIFLDPGAKDYSKREQYGFWNQNRYVWSI